MKSVIKRIQNSKGFVSIEYIMIAGVVLLIASIVLLYFKNEAQKMSGSAVTQLQNANKSMEPTSTTP